MYIIENGVVMVDIFNNGEVYDVEWVDYYYIYLNVVCVVIC